jgi:redox-sensitive bicupin YhaK (pirin superfamily)
MGPADYAPGEAVGAPDHPHRGFETVTYLLSGEMEHEDSAGHRGALGSGDVQWMTAGSGVVHSEMPSRKILRDGGRLHGFQLWVNLPRRDKMIAPRYQEVPADRIPKAFSPDGKARVAVIAGEALGVNAVIETRTPILYHDWTLEPGADVTTAVPDGFDAFAYVFEGNALVSGQETVDGQMVLLGSGDAVRLARAEGTRGPARVLLVGGMPLREPVARWGPFVMNTEGEIRQALLDFQSGRMGRIDR